MDRARLRAEALAVIRGNDRGDYSIPTAGLYPFQWNWDSALTALGMATYDLPRAWREVETLAAAQRPDGMVPHIVFWQEDPGYFPSHAAWGTAGDPPASGITQPPVLASVVLALAQRGGAEGRRRAAALAKPLLAWHRWFHTLREPAGDGLVALTHPWESGRDNSPDWDRPLAAVEVPADLPAYQRRDLDHVDADARPTRGQYDRFMALVAHGRACGWRQEEIVASAPFLVCDPGVQFILLRADRDLLEILALREGGGGAEAAEVEGWIERGEAACARLWSEEAGGYCARDLKRGELTAAACSNASMLAWYAGIRDEEKMARLAATAAALLDEAPCGMPSWDPRAAGYDAKRYWRGPAWAIMNHMIAQGMREQGEEELARRLAQAQGRLYAAGFREYYEPRSGAGLGGGAFSWTAAVFLLWDSEELF
ncbi:MAG: hypothetical protein ISN26_05560 [Betaproteobacteria bacterium AqS2]|uniref:Mannosylglycerate hydrolase MGH1-like glycoside hydrolase domain-containing protein n=1 Tax=Candidatus Amphirhobacter heronislandensis TaxID=1732024 RepID=A0A930UGV4_9GAMM|nr:hypothetical protein [Betaproteobacteria bacterium AqS2]